LRVRVTVRVRASKTVDATDRKKYHFEFYLFVCLFIWFAYNTFIVNQWNASGSDEDEDGEVVAQFFPLVLMHMDL
jgi:hypothetical protein